MDTEAYGNGFVPIDESDGSGVSDSGDDSDYKQSSNSKKSSSSKQQRHNSSQRRNKKLGESEKEYGWNGQALSSPQNPAAAAAAAAGSSNTNKNSSKGRGGKRKYANGLDDYRDSLIKHLERMSLPPYTLCVT